MKVWCHAYGFASRQIPGICRHATNLRNVDSNIKKMRQVLFILIVFLITSCSQKKFVAVDFTILIFNLDAPQDSSEYYNWKMKYLKQQNHLAIETLFAQDSIPFGVPYYIDKDFKAYGYCSGEFGGALMFQDRHKTDSIYYLSCTCPVMIDRRPDGYYITESLAHSEGWGKVLFFTSPKVLVNVHLDSLETNWEKTKFPGLNEHEIWKKLENQGKVLIDTTGLTFSIFFPFKDNNYLIFSDFNNTYIGYLTSGHLIAIDTILNIPTRGYSYSPNDIINNFYHYNFKRIFGSGYDKNYTETIASGDIYVRNDTIIIAYKYKIETKHKK